MSRGRGRPLGSTYRLQLHGGVDLSNARALVPYLHALGVETLYVSPLLAASAGSTHGYDVIDPTRIDPALGDRADFDGLLDELDRHGMRLLIDAVPNHMAVDPDNRWWWDVLRHGRRSAHAPVFDVDWDAGAGRVVLATLDRPLADALAADQVQVTDNDGAPAVSVGPQRFPLDPDTTEDLGGPLVSLLARQHYRLAFWRVARFEGNYRRFFDIDRLIGVRVSDPAVYEATQRLLLELVADRRVAGLRIDHIDGLAEPADYLQRLREDAAAPRSDDPPSLLVEKILGRDERLPSSWPVEGTTGYEFADLSTRLFVDPVGAEAFRTLGDRLSGDTRDFVQLSLVAKKEVLDGAFVGQLGRLARLAQRAMEAAVPGLDLAAEPLSAALRSLIAHLDVYRTYLSDATARRTNRSRLAAAAAGAAAELTGEDARALRALVSFLGSARPPGQIAAILRRDLGVRVEQLSGAVAAKGVEDTASYRFHGLLATAEVGGDPMSPHLRPEELHAVLRERSRLSPRALNALSTHDTKRSTDVRARLAALSEVAPGWERVVRRWQRRAAEVVRGGLPEATDRLFVYQSLVGLWAPGATDPDELGERLRTTAQKAAREAKVATSWLDPDQSYEHRLAAFVDATVTDPVVRRDLDRLLERIGPAAATVSLAMVLLAATAPGVPDLYQGSEGWQRALVDPDNRRTVDFAAAAATLAALEQPSAEDAPARVAALLGSYADGRIKVWVTRALLTLRRERPTLFDAGAYVPLDVRGARRHALVAFARRRGRQWAVSVLPTATVSVCGPGRFAVGAEPWRDTRVVVPEGAPERFCDRFTGRRLSARRHELVVGEVLEVLPVAVLTEAPA